MSDEYPKFTAAAVQAAPVFLDREATVDKACTLIAEAASQGAKLIVFPETWVPAYPFWIATPQIFTPAAFVELFKNSVEVPSDATDALCTAAAKAGSYVVIGINERDSESKGTLYNSLLYIDDAGKILGVHRKLMPTFTERTIWGWGDGSGLHVFETPLGRLGGLICWEHEMTLVKYAFYAKGEQVHASVWPAWTMQKNSIDFGCRQYAFEGGCFAVVSCGILLDDTLPQQFRSPLIQAAGGSGIIGPNGEYLRGPVYDKEEIVYADLDLEATIRVKHMRDVVGHYARPDVTQLLLHEQPQRPVISSDDRVAELRVQLGELLSRIDGYDDAASDPEVLATLRQLERALARVSEAGTS
jgi:aliphatic nitrilase